MTGVEIKLDDADVLRELARVAERIGNPRGMLALVGEILVRSTRERFATSTAPDGSAWQKNSATTLERYVEAFAMSRTKTGNRSAAGRRRGAAKKPLIGESRSLSRQIHYQVDGTTLRVGSTMEYAGTQQFGARMGEFGRYSQLSRRHKFAEGDFRRKAGTVKGFPIPWGNIPARPFLGMSAEDRERILTELRVMLGGGS